MSWLKSFLKHAKLLSASTMHGSGYERMANGGHPDMMLMIFTGELATRMTLTQLNAKPMVLLWLLSRYADGRESANQKRQPNHKQNPLIAISNPNNVPDQALAKYFSELHTRLKINCYRRNHAHPAHGFDLQNGAVNVWCDKNGGFVARLPWIQFLKIMAYVTLPWNIRSDRFPSTARLNMFAKDMRLDPTSQPKLMTVGDWVQVNVEHDDFGEILKPVDEFQWTRL